VPSIFGVELARDPDDDAEPAGALRHLARESGPLESHGGGHVVLADKDGKGVRSLEAEVNERLPQRACAVAADVADESSLEGAFREAVLTFGGVDVLFYSPGIVPHLHSVAEMPLEEVRRQLAVHYEGAVAATRIASRIMLDQACPEPALSSVEGRNRRGLGGRLIYNASKAAFAPGLDAAAYGASKAALVHYVRNAAAELGRYGITANYINTDAIDTPLFRALLRARAQREGKPEADVLGRYAERSVFGEATVPPEYVAEAVLFLASERARYTTGCVITVGGGYEGFPR
jgi:NAD(P)-dependent dehydrogenase (short-subunit alcohol dehydrogenase family)